MRKVTKLKLYIDLKIIKYTDTKIERKGEVSQESRAFIALAESLDSVLSTHIVVPKYL